MKTFSFKIRSVQLDLARQMETLDFIKSFIDFIARFGFNSLTLYLEGRIRTASFSYPSPSESYTPAEMREIVHYATSKGIDVIPVVSVLGHAELFLRHQELAHLAETDETVPGRFGPSPRTTFCPSRGETVSFFRTYLAELCEIFPSPYFHVGSDEVWDIGCCPLCLERFANGESQGDLFVKHLQAVHDIVTRELGKRMIVWDDMLEYYPEILEFVPRDVIMACWQYEEQVEQARAHLFHRATDNRLATYDQLGFEYLICPADYTLGNAESFTAYGANHAPLGGLLTIWEKSESFLFQIFPLIASAGRRWESGCLNDDGVILRGVVGEIFGLDDETFIQAIRSLCYDDFPRERRIRIEDYLTQRENEPDRSRENLVKMLLTILPGFQGQIKPSAHDILDEMLLLLRSEAIAFQLADLVPRFFDHSSNVDQYAGKLDVVIGQLESLAAERIAKWNRVRAGIVPCHMESLYEKYLSNLRQLPALSSNHGTLKVHFFLPDQYSAQNIRVFIRYAENPHFEKIAEGVFKELQTFDCFYSRIFLIDENRFPQAVKIESEGFGGQGFTSFEVRNSQGRFLPAKIKAVRGIVTDPENLLRADWTWTFVGERDTKKSYFETMRATEVHGFEVTLQKSRDEAGVENLLPDGGKNPDQPEGFRPI